MLIYWGDLVPPLGAQVDLSAAWKRYKRDIENVNLVYSNNSEVSLWNNWRIPLNHRDWTRFWSVHHPKAQEREKATLALREFDASVQRIAAKAQRCLQRAQE